ncbi:MAG: DUF1456 family protein [Fluviicola sp.]|jgi:uncharacterized protein YehS (DUF1456 family)
MDNNFVFYKLRKIFSWDEEELGQLYKSVDYPVSPLDLFAWMKQEQYEGFKEMPDQALNALLNALIISKRGMKDNQIPEHEPVVFNNLTFRKLKIALTLKDDEIIELMKAADMRIGKAELSSFFRDKKHPHYRICGDQFLRNFIKGIELKYRN